MIGRFFSILLSMGLIGLSGRSSFGAVPLRTIREILALTPEQAATRVPVALEALLLFNDTYRSTFFIHDGEKACYTKIEAPQRAGLQRGHRYRLVGVTDPGGFQPVVFVDTIADLGPAAEPEPLALTAADLFRTTNDAQWVEVEGMIESSSLRDGGPSLDVRVDGWLIEAVMPRQQTATVVLPWHLVGQRVKIRGVAAGNFNDQRQMLRRFIYTPSIGHVIPVMPANAGRMTPVTVDSLLRVGLELDHRVVLRATVTHVLPGTALFVKDATGSLRVLTAQLLDLQPGDLVEAEGFPAMEPMRPALRATDIRKLEAGPRPVPVPLEPGKPLGTHLHHELAQTRVNLLTINEAPDGFVLQCEADGRNFECLLDKRLALNLPPDLTPESTLVLTGLVELLPSRFFTMSDWIGGFRLHLRSAGDIRVVARPPWWNAHRLLWLLAGVGGVGIGAAAWGNTLRRTVKAQTVVIRDKVEREAVLEERQRIAREMHDTFQQSLAGAGHLLDDALRRLKGSGHGASNPLSLARQMLRHCREEARSSITDLRAIALESRSLPEVLDELLRPLVENAGIRFDLEVPDAFPELEGSRPHALLRIAQEAVNNALHHAGAGRIRIILGSHADQVSLTIEDDGIGFDPASINARQGHFGLLGMKERALKLDGRVTITSAPGASTSITVTLPLHPCHPEGLAASFNA